MKEETKERKKAKRRISTASSPSLFDAFQRHTIEFERKGEQHDNTEQGFEEDDGR